VQFISKKWKYSWFFQIMEIMALFPDFGNKKQRQKYIGRWQLNPFLSISADKMQN